MSQFEAVPCVFKGRAEDGNEASLFGLLIRPSSQQVANNPTTSSSSSTPSAIQIVPSNQEGSSKSVQPCLSTPTTIGKQQHPRASKSKTSTNASSSNNNPGANTTSTTTTTTATTNNIPISPKTILPAPTKQLPLAMHSHYGNHLQHHLASGPQQLVHLQPMNIWPSANHGCTTQQSSSTFVQYGQSHSNTYGINHQPQPQQQQFFEINAAGSVGLSPQQQSIAMRNGSANAYPTAQHMRAMATKPGFESPSPSQVVPQLLRQSAEATTELLIATSRSPSATSLAYPRQMPAQGGNNYSMVSQSPLMHSPPLKEKPGQQSNRCPIPRLHEISAVSKAGVTDANESIEDLNCIDYAELVHANSAITITTEDYLPQHSTLTFSSMDMGQSGEIGIHIDQPAPQMNNRAHAAINSKPDAHYQQYLQTSSSVGVGNRQQQQQYQQAWQSHPAAHLQHNYMAGGNQVNSSTPDSGIESGSPPSVSSYTPPMVSPYTTQITSCDSGQYPLSIPNMSVASASSVNTKSGSADEFPMNDDFSDMPTLLPVMGHQCDEGQGSEGLPGNEFLDMTPPAIDDAMNPPSVTSNGPSSNKKVEVVDDSTSESTSVVNTLLSLAPSLSLVEIADKMNAIFAPNELSQLTSLIQKAASTQQSSCTKDESQAKCAPTSPSHSPSPRRDALSTKINPKEVVEETCSRAEQCFSSEEQAGHSMDTHNDQCPSSSSSSEESEVNRRCRLAIYRRQVRVKLNEKLGGIVDSLEKHFKSVELNMGPALKFPPPWRQLDWPSVSRRLRNNSLSFPPVSESSSSFYHSARCSTKKEETLRRKRKRVDRIDKQKDDDTDSEEEDSNSFSLAKKTKRSKFISSLVTGKMNGSLQRGAGGENIKRKVRPLKDDYVKIRSNILLEPPPRVEAEPYECDCSDVKFACSASSSCTHRSKHVECTASTCELSSTTCQNRRISNNQAVHHLQICRADDNGQCVKTTEGIKKGQYICEYLGEVIRRSTFLRRYAKQQERHRCGVEFVPGFVIDANKKGNTSRFLNHICHSSDVNPNNCELQRWLVNGVYRVGVFARKNIAEGEKLSYDYGAECLHVASDQSQRCHCNSSDESTSESTDLGLQVSSIPIHRQKGRRHLHLGELKTLENLPLGVFRHAMVFLPRNIRKSAGALQRLSQKQMIPLFRLPKALSDVKNDSNRLAHMLITVYKNFALFCVKREQVSYRKINHLRRAIQLVFSPCHLRQLRKPFDSSDSEQLSQLELLVDRFDAAVKNNMALLQKAFDRRRLEAIKSNYAHLKKSHTADLLRDRPSFPKQILQNFLEEKRKSHVQMTKRDTPKILTAEADLSYMDSRHPVGSTNPDRASRLTLSDNKDEDCVRCICGIMEDDGVMTQCDRCHFWLHADCLDFDINARKEFICDFCSRNLEYTPNVDIVLTPQPTIKFSGCTYYRTLVNSRGIQVRVNEAVYVERLINDEHKSILKKLHEQCAKSGTERTKRHEPSEKSQFKPDSESRRKMMKKRGESTIEEDSSRITNAWWQPPAKSLKEEHFHRKDLRTFRIERIFKGPNGQRFVFGVYYARPHETFCDSTRMFYKNELFWTPLFDTLPLDSVVGRCLILEPQVWSTGRPKSPKYLEQDVFICEFQIDKNQRCFEKLKNRYFINTESYVFDEFPNKLMPKRDFTPFILPSGVSSKSDKPAEARPRDCANSKQRIGALVKEMRIDNLELVCQGIKQKRSLR